MIALCFLVSCAHVSSSKNELIFDRVSSDGVVDQYIIADRDPSGCNFFVSTGPNFTQSSMEVVAEKYIIDPIGLSGFLIPIDRLERAWSYEGKKFRYIDSLPPKFKPKLKLPVKDFEVIEYVYPDGFVVYVLTTDRFFVVGKIVASNGVQVLVRHFDKRFFDGCLPGVLTPESPSS
jgi:hypothetical protein